MHQRRSIRLQNYDHAQAGAYFVTIVTHIRECLFGEIANGEMRLNEFGEIVETWWHDIEKHFDDVELDSFVIMPNHIHGIIVFGAGSPRPENTPPEHPAHKSPTPTNDAAKIIVGTQEGAETAPLRKRRTLGNVVAYFKYQSTKHINLHRHTPAHPVWQRNYYEHIVRDEHDLNRIRTYLIHNPAQWTRDEHHQ